MRFIVSLVAVLTALGVGAFAFLSAERTIAVPALAIASPQVAPESRSVAAPSRHTPDSQFAQVGAAETPGASGAPTRVEQESQAAAPTGDGRLHKKIYGTEISIRFRDQMRRQR